MGANPKDERVSLHPLDPRAALTALLRAKSSDVDHGRPEPKNGKRGKPTRHDKADS